MAILLAIQVWSQWVSNVRSDFPGKLKNSVELRLKVAMSVTSAVSNEPGITITGISPINAVFQNEYVNA